MKYSVMLMAENPSNFGLTTASSIPAGRRLMHLQWVCGPQEGKCSHKTRFDVDG